MPIFPRRVIQDKLDYLYDRVSSKDLDRLIKTLNLSGNKKNEKRYIETLSAAWEVVLISSFFEVGDLSYEAKISNGKAPDISFKNKDTEFIADIVSISDDQQHQKNPSHKFSEVIHLLQKENDLKGAFDWRINNVEIDFSSERKENQDFSFSMYMNMPNIRKSRIVRLKLPPIEKLDQWLRNRLKEFFEKCRSSKENQKIIVNEYFNKDIEVDFCLEYKPNGRYGSGSHRSYTGPNDPERHVLWSRILEKSEKQFGGASEAIPRGLFVCDAGCSLLEGGSVGTSNNSLNEIIRYFWHRKSFNEKSQKIEWEKETNISFIVVLTIEDKARYSHGTKEKLRIKPILFTNPHSPFPIDKEGIELLNKGICKIPKPIKWPYNALNNIKANPYSTNRYNTISMKGNEEITISSIQLLRILAGEITFDEIWGDSTIPNPFKLALKNHRTISQLILNKLDDLDDDQLTIKLNDFDVALGAYQKRKPSNKE